MGNKESYVPQPTNSNLNADLAELKEIEKVITSQLNELGEKVDSSFTKAAQFVSNLTDLAMSMSRGRNSSTTRDAIQFAGMTVSAAIKGVGDAYAAYKRNKVLDALLVQKQQIANAKKGALQKILPRVEHLTSKFSKLLESYTLKDYDMERLRNDSYANLLYHNIDSSLGMLRAAAFNQAMAEYILAEYNAWIDGNQQSKLRQPTYWNVNKDILKQLGEPDLLEMIDRYSANSVSVSGKELCVLHDSQLLSVEISENNSRLFDTGLQSRRPAGGIDGVMERLEGVKQHNGMLLPEPSFFDDYTSNVYDLQENNSTLKKTKTAINICMLAALVLVAILFINLSWAVWLRWVLGIICELLVLGGIASLDEHFTEPLVNKGKIIIKRNYDGYREKSGYIYIPKQNLERKSVVGSFLNNFK